MVLTIVCATDNMSQELSFLLPQHDSCLPLVLPAELTLSGTLTEVFLLGLRRERDLELARRMQLEEERRYQEAAAIQQQRQRHAQRHHAAPPGRDRVCHCL